MDWVAIFQVKILALRHQLLRSSNKALQTLPVAVSDPQCILPAKATMIGQTDNEPGYC